MQSRDDDDRRYERDDRDDRTEERDDADVRDDRRDRNRRDWRDDPAADPDYDDRVNDGPRNRRAAPEGPSRIYTMTDAVNGAFTPQELEQLAKMDIDDPHAAQTYRFQKLEWAKAELNRYADQQLEMAEADFRSREPDLYRLYRSDIERACRRMTVDDKQRHRIIDQVVGQLMISDRRVKQNLTSPARRDDRDDRNDRDDRDARRRDDRDEPRFARQADDDDDRDYDSGSQSVDRNRRDDRRDVRDDRRDDRRAETRVQPREDRMPAGGGSRRSEQEPRRRSAGTAEDIARRMYPDMSDQEIQKFLEESRRGGGRR